MSAEQINDYAEFFRTSRRPNKPNWRPWKLWGVALGMFVLGVVVGECRPFRQSIPFSQPTRTPTLDPAIATNVAGIRLRPGIFVTPSPSAVKNNP